MLNFDRNPLCLNGFTLSPAIVVSSWLNLTPWIGNGLIGTPLVVVFILAVPIVDVINEFTVDSSIAGLEFPQKRFGGGIIDF